MKIVRLGLYTAWLLVAFVSRAALFYTEEWDGSSTEGWTTKDVYLSLSHASDMGSPPGSLQGTFAEQTLPTPETDSFRATESSSGGAFTGDYITDLGGAFWGWRFSFYAANFVPSDLQLRFSDGTNTFLYNALPQLGGTGAWYTISAPADPQAGWFGPLTQWTSTLRNVAFVEVQVTRNGSTQEQSYFLDNFQTVPIPEPATFGLALLAVGILRRGLHYVRSSAPFSEGVRRSV